MYKFRQDFYADIRIEDRFTTSIIYKNDILEECRAVSEKTAFLRVFDGEMWYYKSTTDTQNIQKALDGLYVYAAAPQDNTAMEMAPAPATATGKQADTDDSAAKSLVTETADAAAAADTASIKDAYTDTVAVKNAATDGAARVSAADSPAIQKLKAVTDTVIRYKDNCVKDVPLKTKQQFALALHSRLQSPYLKLRLTYYQDRYSVFEFYSSKGSEIAYDYQVCGHYNILALAQDDKNFKSGLPQSAVNFDELSSADIPLEEFIAEAERFMLYAKSVKPGSYPVVLSPEVAGVFAHESFGHKSEADFMLSDETMAREWSIGKRVASPLLTIVDTGMLPGAGYVPYDDEGTKASKTYLIKDGVLAGRLHSSETAAALNEELTGNARAVSCDFEPIVRMTSTYIEAGNSTFNQLVSGIKHGFYIKTCLHGSGMSTFTIAPGIAYEIVDGKIGDPVKISVITGNVFETLGDIDGVGDDLKVTGFVMGGCGKMEQYPLSVGLGGPHIRVSKVNVQ